MKTEVLNELQKNSGAEKIQFAGEDGYYIYCRGTNEYRLDKTTLEINWRVPGNESEAWKYGGMLKRN